MGQARSHCLDVAVRPSAAHNLITGSTISFSTGTSVNVPSLPMDGSALVINFPAVKVTSLTFTLTSVGPMSTAVGLEEIQAFTETYVKSSPKSL
ncbi:hypothetical protein RQP46_007400 [Phenoliferia psychrophenolica]